MQLLGRVIGRADYPAGVSQNDGRRVLFAQSQTDWSDIFNLIPSHKREVAYDS